MYQLDFALNNLQWLICPKTKPDHEKKYCSKASYHKRKWFTKWKT